MTRKEDISILPKIVVFLMTTVFGFVIVYTIANSSSKTKTPTSTDIFEIHHVVYKSDHYKAAAVWLSEQGITTLERQLENYSHESIDGDKLYGVIRKGIGSHSSDTTLLRLEGYHPLALPSGTLIVLPDRCIIFNGGTRSEIHGWDPVSGVMQSWSMETFKNDYINAGSISYILLPRGYTIYTEN